MTALLTDNLPLLAGAPNGIKKLRELILELAVRGKLVEQDASDEPASKLLKRIAVEKARLVEKGAIKKQKPLTEITEADKRFELPVGWEWCRLAQTVEFVNGFAFSSKDFGSEGVGVVKIGDIQNNELTPETMSRVKSAIVDDLDKRFRVEPGDLLIAMSGATTGKLGFNTTEEIFYLNQRVGKIIPICTNTRFVFFDLTIKIVENLKKSFGSAIPNLSTEQINDILIALPPLSEQHRIVAKVDELMALCDRLEAQQADAASAHAQLVQALLGSLTQASDATEFATNWERLSEHFHTLFSTEPSIDVLKQTLLQLAVMGKLVPQDPSNEPARELCKRIEAEKQCLVAAKKIKDTPKLEPVSADEELFSVPPSWAWIRMGDICRPISSGSTPSSELFQYDEGIPFLKVYNIRNQEVDFDYKKQFVSAKHHAEKMRRSTLVPGDVVMNIVGPPLGKVAIIPDAFPEWNCNQAIVFFGLIAPVSSQYIYTFLKEGSFLKNIALIGTAGQDNISVTKSKNIAVPLPPLAEQHRIVAKVDQLMALCDQLKTQLSQARQLNQQLASTLVEQAIA